MPFTPLPPKSTKAKRFTSLSTPVAELPEYQPGGPSSPVDQAMGSFRSSLFANPLTAPAAFMSNPKRALEGTREAMLGYGILTADEDDALRAMIEARDPGAQLIRREGQNVVRRADGSEYVLNAKGLSANDLRSFGAEAAPYAIPGPGGLLAKVGTGGILRALTRGAVQAAPGALVSAGAQAAVRPAAGLDVNLADRAKGAAGDVAAGALFSRPVEKLVKSGAQTLGKGWAKLLDTFKPAVPTVEAKEARRLADKFEIPLAGPQVSNDPIGLGRLAQAARGTSDTPGREAVSAFMGSQQAARGAASDKLRGAMVPAGQTGEALGQELQAPLIREASDLYSRYTNLYNAIPTSAKVNPAFFGGEGWMGFLRGARDDLATYSKEEIPQVLGVMGDAVGLATKEGGASFRADWSGIRRRLGEIVRADPGSTEATAARKALAQFAKAEDALATQPGNIMVEASARGNSPSSEGLVSVLREANAARRQYAQKFENDDVIEALVETARGKAGGPTTIDSTSVSEKLFGKTPTNINFTNFDQRIGALKQAAPEQFNAVRGDLAERVLNRIDAARSTGEMDKALGWIGQNEQRLLSAFDANELQTFREYAKARSNSMRTSGAVSPSGGSVGDLRRMFLGAIYAGGGAVSGNAIGGPGLGMAFAAAAPAASAWSRMREATQVQQLLDAGRPDQFGRRVVSPLFGAGVARTASRATPPTLDFLTNPDRNTQRPRRRR
jgi:hypothetical protein